MEPTRNLENLRRPWRIAWLIAAAAAGLGAQGSTAITYVSASAKDAVFIVDGQGFTGTAAFPWPAGTKHTLEIAAWQYAPVRPRARYTFQRWNTAAGPLGSASNIVTITADPAISWYNADLITEFVVSLVYFQCSDGPCVSPGTIWVNQVPYQHDADIWLAAGATVTLEASPNPGFVFAGWSQGGVLPAIYSFVLDAPILIYPRFAQARVIHLLTSPDELQILADHAPVSGGVTLEWGWDTSHVLSAVSPQLDKQGRQWVFRSWSDGGAADHAYQVAPLSAAATVVAQFVRAVPATLTSSPQGLNLTVDGLDSPTPRTFFWGPGESHTAAAPAHQVDSAGGPWAFRQWSTGTSSTQTIAVTDADVETGIRLTATYDPLSRIRLESDPSGLLLAIDSTSCRSPCDVERAVGATVQLGAPPAIPAGDGVRLDFLSWDGTAGATLAAPAGFHRITAHYRTSYLLAAAMRPAGAGSWRILPLSADGYYPGGSLLTIGVDPADGMQFDRWAYDLNGSLNPSVLMMDAPHQVEARFNQVPKAPPPPRVSNAAGETPVPAVAPGSIASLFGTGLADSTASSAAVPLPQSLAGVSLVCSGRLLSLLYVSPQQINFQIPADFTPGPYQLDVHRSTGPTVGVSFDILRNAPGLLAVSHEDGTPITSDAPARPGERISLYGTGIGPYQSTPLDGFPVPATPQFPLTDPVKAIIQGRELVPEQATAAPGTVGVVLITVRLPDEVDPATAATVWLRVSGVASNTLPLPLE